MIKKKQRKNKKFNINQQSFYFEDYLETKKKNRKITSSNLSQDRIYLLFFLFFSLIVIFSIKIVFISLQTAFNTMDFGNIIGPIFFILLSVAALSSSISILEPGVAYLAEEGYLSRTKSAIIISITCWVIGIGTAFGFDQDGNNFFQANVELISVQPYKTF